MSEPSPRDQMRALLRAEGSFQSGELAEATGLSRQALQRHLSRAVDEGWLVREGAGRGTRYRSADTPGFRWIGATNEGGEDRVLDEIAAWLGSDVGTPEASMTLRYVVAELVNNAIDHSGAAEVLVEARRQDETLEVVVVDEGIGAFENLRSRLALEDHLHALQQLTQGKLTTQPDRHSGEGLFFSSKVVAHFELTANGLSWIVDAALQDQTVRASEERPGTRVVFELDLSARRSLSETFDRFTTDLQFDRTRCTVRLYEQGVHFVSRSEARRLLTRLERFRVVEFDFDRVPAVGQGFVDEIFRVWANKHPSVELRPTRMNAEVEFMVRRGLASGRAASGAEGSG